MKWVKPSWTCSTISQDDEGSVIVNFFKDIIPYFIESGTRSIHQDQEAWNKMECTWYWAGTFIVLILDGNSKIGEHVRAISVI